MNIQRENAFDALKCFAIFLVLWGHSIQYLQSLPFQENLVYRIIYSFHMPLFVMVSGYFASSSLEMAFLPFVKKKFIQLFLPALTWSLMVGGADYLISGDNTILTHIVSDYWFLKALFVCFFIAWLGNKSKLKLWGWILITIILTQFIERFKIPLLYPCFIVGYLLKQYNLKGLLSKTLIVCCVGVAFTVGLLFWDQSFWGDVMGFRRALSEALSGNLDFKWFYYRYYPYIMGLLGGLFFIGLFLNMQNYYIQSRFYNGLAYCGSKTLGIYLIQLLLLETILPHYISLDGVDLVLFELVITPVVALSIMVVCIIVIHHIEKSDLASFLLLGKAKK